MELIRSSPGLVLLPLVFGVVIAVLFGVLRSRMWVPLFINGEYRQSGASFCIGLLGGVVTVAAIVGAFAISSAERAAEGWRERERAKLSADNQWQSELFRRLFDEVRKSQREDLGSIPDPVANGGTQLPLTKPESWKLAAQTCHEAVWSRLQMDRSPLAGGWPEQPAAPEVPVTPGMVSPHPSENPALFAAIEKDTLAAASHATERVRKSEGGYRSALIVALLLAQLASWITISVSASRDISAG